MWTKPANTPPYTEWLFVDTISIVVRIGADRTAVIAEQINDSYEHFQPFITLRNPRNTTTQWFILSLENNEQVANIFFTLRNGRNSSLKVAYEANNLGEAGRRILRDFLEFTLGSTWEDDMRNGELTRIDLAFDVSGMAMQNLLIVDTRSRESAYIRGESGEVETYYSPFGRNTPTTKQLRVYDKRRELASRGGSGIRHSRSPLTRFEYGQRSLRGYTLNTFMEKQMRRGNPFDAYTVMEFAPDELHGLTVDQQRFFFDACRVRGRGNALAEVQNARLQAALAHLCVNPAQHTPKFYSRRTSIWAGLQRAIQFSLPIGTPTSRRGR